MSYFYPFEVSLNKAHRNLLRRGVIHMWPCVHMQVHFYRYKYLHGGQESSGSMLTLQCRCQPVSSIRKKLQPGLEIAILVIFLRFLKFLRHLNVH